MDLKLKEKVIALVGGTSGMGLAAAKILAEEGANIALICRDTQRGNVKAKMLTDSWGTDVRVYGADGACETDLLQAIDSLASDFGGLDGLAITAGPMQKMAPFMELADSDWQDFFDSQIMTTVRACRAALPHLAARGGGNIVLTAAYSVRHAKETLAAYAAMKSGVVSISKNIAKHWGSQGIRCNCIAPGAIATEAMDDIRVAAEAHYGNTLTSDEALDRFMIENWQLDVAMQRLGRPREVGELIAFLLSPLAGYMTGSLINIDGGTDF